MQRADAILTTGEARPGAAPVRGKGRVRLHPAMWGVIWVLGMLWAYVASMGPVYGALCRGWLPSSGEAAYVAVYEPVYLVMEKLPEGQQAQFEAWMRWCSGEAAMACGYGGE